VASPLLVVAAAWALLAVAAQGADLAPEAAPAAPPTVSFANDVMPVLTKAGCNLGVCHAKAGGGQNGFQLSLLGFEPLSDHEHLTSNDRGRRLSPHTPEASLLLRKAAGLIPHGGGVRIKPNSPEFALLAREPSVPCL
jgi:hypothetical protein